MTFTRPKIKRGRLRSPLGLILMGLLAFTLTTSWVSVTVAQMPVQPTSQPAASAQTSPPAPAGRLGKLVFSPVKLDGHILFRVGAVEAERANGEEVDSPLKRRVEFIQNELYRIIEADFDPNALDVKVGTLNRQTVILVSDRKQEGLTNIPVVTVTATDARLYGLPVPKWSRKLAVIIRKALIQAQKERQPTYLTQQGLISAAVLGGVIGVVWSLSALQKRIQAQLEALRKQKLEAKSNRGSELSHGPVDESEAKLDQDAAIARQKQRLRLQRRINVKILQRGLLRLGRLVIWAGGIAWIAGQFPWTREIQNWLLAEPLKLLGVVIASILALRLANYFIDRSFNVLAEEEASPDTSPSRQNIRFSTFSGTLKGLSTFVIIALGIIAGLQTMGIPVAPVLAGAGIVGLGISFASQNLIKDVINGSLILLEDQYAIGDFIRLGGITGMG